MPVLANPRHEKFVTFLADGKTATEAYELCGYMPSRFNASKLANNPAVKERVIQITTSRSRIAVTADSLLDEAEQARAQAMKNGREGAAVNAIKVKSVLSGKWIERAEIGGPGEFDNLSDNELKHLLIERLVQAAPELGISIGSIAALNGNGADTDITEGS
jgi:hypothetical protein